MAEDRAVKFCTQVGYIKSYQMNQKSPSKGAWSWSHDVFKFQETSDDISEKVQDRDIVTVEGKEAIIYDLE